MGCSKKDKKKKSKIPHVPEDCTPADQGAGHVPSGSARHPVDFLIVGAGTAGAPLANLLSADNKTSVLVLEAGSDQSQEAQVQQGSPFGSDTMGGDPQFSFERSASARTNQPAALLPAGRMIGGTSGQNDLTAVRGAPETYNQWGIVHPQWSYFNLLPVMKFLELYSPQGPVANPQERGFSGSLFVTQDAQLVPGPYVNALAAASQSPIGNDYNESNGDTGVFPTQWFVTPASTNQRSFAQSAFLGPNVVDAQGRGLKGRKLLVKTKSTATQVIFDTRGATPRAIGVRFVDQATGSVQEVFAKKKVILSAGTVGTAQLLQLSGVGDPTLLQGLGIPVVVANANVGAHVQALYGPMALLAQGDNPVPPDQVVQVFSDLSGSPLPNPNDGVRRAQLVTVPDASLVPDAIVTACGGTAANKNSLQGYILQPNNLGTVQIVSNDPLTQPEIQLHFYEDQDGVDLENAINIYLLIAKVAAAYTGGLPVYPPAAHYPASVGGGAGTDLSLLEQDAKDATTRFTSTELTGSARMAKTATDGVVDGNLNVFGTTGLGIADSSVMPLIPSGNTPSYAAYVVGLQKAKIEGASTPF